MHSLSPLIREPLLHFILLGAALFMLFSWVDRDSVRAVNEIVIDQMRVDTLRLQFERVWQRPPTKDELSERIDDWVLEEILYREGIALGLDRDDPVLRQRVAQKMKFIYEGFADTATTEKELQAWFTTNIGKYSIDTRYGFRQVFFDPALHDRTIESVIAETRRALANGGARESDATLLPESLSNANLSEIRSTFGELFASNFGKLPVGEWVGPVESDYGLHLVRIDAKEPAREPAFAEVRATVQRDYQADRAQDGMAAIYEELRQRYTIVYRDVATIAGAANAAAAAE